MTHQSHHHHSNTKKDAIGEYRKQMAHRAKMRKKMPKILLRIGIGIAAFMVLLVLALVFFDR